MLPCAAKCKRCDSLLQTGSILFSFVHVCRLCVNSADLNRLSVLNSLVSLVTVACFCFCTVGEYCRRLRVQHGHVSSPATCNLRNLTSVLFCSWQMQDASTEAMAFYFQRLSSVLVWFDALQFAGTKILVTTARIDKCVIALLDFHSIHAQRDDESEQPGSYARQCASVQSVCPRRSSLVRLAR